MAIFDFSDINDDEDELTPSQKAREQVKATTEKKKTESQIFDFSDIKDEEPAQSQKIEAPEEKKSLAQKAGGIVVGAAERIKNFVVGAPAQSAGEKDQRYATYMEGVIKDNQEVAELSKKAKLELINYFKDNVDPESNWREVVAGLTVENFDEKKGQLEKLAASPNAYKVIGEQEVGKGIFKRKQKIRANEYGNKITGNSQTNPQELFDRIKSLEYAKQDNDEFLGYETTSKGIVRGLIDNLKDFEYKIHPYSANRYQEMIATNQRQAIEKYQKGEPLDDKDLAYIKTFRAKAFNNLVEKGMGDMAADVVTGSLGMGMQMFMDAQLTGNVSGAAAPALAKIPAGKAKTIIEKILGNSVQLAVQSNYNIPSMDARTAEYMLPTVEYEKWLDENNKTDILENLKEGDDQGSAQRKAYLTNLVEYMSEGVGDYIDDAMPFIKKAFVGKFLKNRGVSDPGEATKLLRTMHINGIVGEVIEEEIGEPVKAYIEEREYNDPFTTPEGRERLLVEVLGIGALKGMSKVADVTIDGIRGNRKKFDNQIAIPIVRDEITDPKAGAAVPPAQEVQPKEVRVFRGSKGKVEESVKKYDRVLEVETNQAELIKKLADEGNADAKALYDSMPNKEKVDFTIADPIIQEAYKENYDAIQYKNQTPQLKAQGTTYFETATGNSFAEQEATAKVYAAQKRSGKYEKPKKFDYSSTQLNLPKSVSNAVTKFSKTIPDASLSVDGDNGGRETEPHITVMYGLDTQNEADVKPLVEQSKPITVKMGKVSVFENDKFDVLKVDVSSPALTALNKSIGKNLKTPGKTFDEYKPHVTIAYLKKGEGKKFAGDKRFQGKTITLNELTFSKKDGTQVKIGLLGKPKKMFKTKEVEVPKKKPSSLPIRTTVESRQKSQLKPVTTPSGIQKKSRAYERALDRIEEEYRTDVNYSSLNIAEEAAKALSFVEKFPEQAVRIAKGLERAPTGYTETAISIAAAEKAFSDKNMQLFSQLEAARSLRQTRRGQEIVMERGRVNENSAHHFVSEVLKARLEAVAKTNRLIFDVQRRVTGKVRSRAQDAVEIIDKKAQALQQKVTRTTVRNLESAQELLNNLTCKI
jgi:2'-5' RNA ligase superfamily